MVERGAVTWGTSDVVRVQSEDSVIMRGFSNLQNLILKQSQTQQQPKGTGFRRQQLLCLDQFGRRYGQKERCLTSTFRSLRSLFSVAHNYYGLTRSCQRARLVLRQGPKRSCLTQPFCSLTAPGSMTLFNAKYCNR